MHRAYPFIEVVVGILITLPVSAWAGPGSEPAGTGYWHEGLHLSAALGGGGLSDSFEGPFGWGDGRAFGGSGAAELTLSGALRPGLFLGGGLFVDWVQAPTIEAEGIEVDGDVQVGVLAIAGPVLDWYPDPGGELHLFGALGGARITVTDESGEREDHEPLGGGIAVGIGWDFWISPHWTLGVRARLTGAALVDEGVTHRVGAGAVLLSLSRN